MAHQRIRRLQWSCRRGMKELDVLLERFLTEEQPGLEQGAWPEFESLLQTEDDRLWNWLQKPGHAEAARFAALLARIRNGTAIRR